MRTCLVIATMVFGLSAATASPAFAQDGIALPQVHADDRWTEINTVERAPSGWSQTHDETTVVRVMDDAITVSTRQVGGTGTPAERIVGRDWSRFRSIGGKEVVVNRPLSFPLTPGKTWDIDYTDTAPTNRAHRSETVAEHYRVTGKEEIDVPAGHFHAIKIEANGHWSAEVAIGAGSVAATQVGPHGATAISSTHAPIHGTVEGRLYKAFWYVPEVNHWVKSVEEYYDANGNRNERFSVELEAWHPGA